MSNSKKKSKSGSAASAKNAASVRKSTQTKSSSSANGKKKLTAAQRRELERQKQITQVLTTVGCLVVALVITMVFVMLYENRNNSKQDYNYTDVSSNPSSTLAEGVYPASKDYKTAPDGEQLEKPKSGEEVAVLETSMGKIKIRLFPEYAPTAVESFKTLIKNGSYDGVAFHRVIDDFMIQGGQIDGVKCAFEGYSSFQDEFNRNLYNFRGALSMANTRVDNTNGTQFFIVQSKTAVYGSLGNVEGFTANGGAKWAADKYEEIGGTPYLDGQFKSITGSGHTVFGQVYEGMNVVDKIAAVKTDQNDAPVEDVKINKAYLEKVK